MADIVDATCIENAFAMLEHRIRTRYGADVKIDGGNGCEVRPQAGRSGYNLEPERG